MRGDCWRRQGSERRGVRWRNHWLIGCLVVFDFSFRGKGMGSRGRRWRGYALPGESGRGGLGKPPSESIRQRDFHQRLLRGCAPWWTQ